MFGSVRPAFGTILANLRKSSEGGRKSSENRQKRRHQHVYIITRGLEALTRMLFSGHRLVCVRRVRPGNEINENGEWFFCKGKKKP